MIPQLVTLTGRNPRGRFDLRIRKLTDLKKYMQPYHYKRLLSGECTAGEVAEYQKIYPELMGFLPLVALIPGAAKAASKIIKKKILPATKKAIAKGIAKTKKRTPAAAQPKISIVRIIRGMQPVLQRDNAFTSAPRH